MRFFLYFSQKISFDISCNLSAKGDNLHEKLKLIFWKKYFKMLSVIEIFIKRVKS